MAHGILSAGKPVTSPLTATVTPLSGESVAGVTTAEAESIALQYFGLNISARPLAGEKDAPKNPKICAHCQTANDPDLELCTSCGAPLPVDLPRVCPKCGRAHTSDALFCQACGTRLVEG